MHNSRFSRQLIDSLFGETETDSILRKIWDETLIHSLALQSKHVQNVRRADYVIDIVRDSDRPMSNIRRKKRARRDNDHFGTKHGKGFHVAASNPTVSNIADDRNGQSFKRINVKRF
jgi:hypothetical protein